MAISGQLVLGGSVWQKAYFDWEVISQQGMKSTVRCKVTQKNLSSKTAITQNSTNPAKINFFIRYSSSIGTSTIEEEINFVNLGGGGYKVLFSYDIAVQRDALTNIGSLFFSGTLSGQSSGPGQISYNPNDYVNDSKSQTWEVDTTTTFGTGAQLLSAPDFNDEENPTITYIYDRAPTVTAATVEAGISFTGATDDIPYREVSIADGSYTFNFTESERATLWTLLRNGSTASIRFYLRTTETVNGETQYIYTYLTKTLTFINYTPTISPTIVDTNPNTIAVTGNPNYLVRYMSTVAFDIGAQPRKGGLEIISQYIQNGGAIVENLETGTFEAPTSNTFYFSATDDRGHTGTAMYSLDPFWGEFINYVKLTNKATPATITGEGNLEVTITGKYFDAYFSANTKNQITLQYMALTDGEETGSFSAPVVIEPQMSSDSTYTYKFTITGLDYTKVYNITVRVNDLLMSQDSTFTAVSIPVFDWGKADFRFNVPVTVDGNVTVTGDILINGVSLLQILREGGLIT